MSKKDNRKMFKKMFARLYDRVVDCYWKKGSRQNQLHGDVFQTMQALENLALGCPVKDDRWGKTAKHFAVHFKEEFGQYKIYVKLGIPLKTKDDK